MSTDSHHLPDEEGGTTTATKRARGEEEGGEEAKKTTLPPPPVILGGGAWGGDREKEISKLVHLWDEAGKELSDREVFKRPRRKLNPTTIVPTSYSAPSGYRDKDMLQEMQHDLRSIKSQLVELMEMVTRGELEKSRREGYMSSQMGRLEERTFNIYSAVLALQHVYTERIGGIGEGGDEI